MVEDEVRCNTAGVAARRTLSALAHAMFALAVVAEAVAAPLGWGLQPRADTWLYLLFALVQAVAGLAILRRHARHAIGWLFLVATVESALGDLCVSYGLQAQER